jgi:peroxiredoxin
MKHLIFLITVTAFLMSCQKEKSTDLIIGNFEKQVEKNKTWEYDINYKMKYFSSDEDTLNYNSNVRLIKHENDSIFGGSFWIKNDSVDGYYDLENIYIINHNQKKITKFFPHKGQDWAINGNTISDFLDSYFLKENRLSKYLKDSTTVSILMDTVFQDSKRNAIEFRFKDDLPIEKQIKTFFFDGDDNLKSITYSVKFQNEWQYNEWHFSNDKYNSITDNDFRSEFELLIKDYKIEDYKEPDPKEMEPLAIGQKAPEFKGFNYQLKDSISLGQYNKKYVLIDFWYKDCFPCIKAIASLNKIRTEYSKDDLVILGLNPFDNKEENKEKLEEFIEINKMNYPTIFVDNAVTKAYNVRAYPTFYIIDDDGNIVYSKIGHNEENETEIDSLLNRWIK